jgi:xylulose-5-phosphate/fructose-6-phosphate phosphoketolase
MNLHVRGRSKLTIPQFFFHHADRTLGYKEKGNIDTPLELAIRNQTDRFSLAMDAIDRMPVLHNRGASARQALLNAQIKARNEAYETGMDPPFLKNWTWPHTGLWKTVSKLTG